MFLGLPDPNPDPLARGTDPDPSLFSKNVLGGLKLCLQNKILAKNKIFQTEDDVPVGKL
jgi:hypothetical protein